MLEERLPGHGRPVEELPATLTFCSMDRPNNDPRLLLQIFGAKTTNGPVFFNSFSAK
jgi:4-hydroxyphenylpyruvate dioxygenase-like putative hemolysin